MWKVIPWIRCHCQWLIGLKPYILSYDGVAFRNHANSKNDHQDTTLANHEGSPLIVGGISTNKVETYDFSKNTWTEVEDYPYHDK